LFEAHPSAVIETRSIGEGVVIDAHCVVGPRVVVGDRVHLHPHVVVSGDVAIGAGSEVFPGAVLGRTPAVSAALSRGSDPDGSVTIGASCSIGSHAVVYNAVEIGPESLLGDFASIREHCRIGARCIVGRGVSLHPDCRIGDGTRIYDHSHIATGSQIGRDCFIGVHVAMTSDNALGRLPYAPDRVRGAVLGDRVSVGSGVVILPAVEIGHDATVDAASIVTRDVKPRTTVRGQPARATTAGDVPQE
jgi:acyl-[acyl carrier protein]--UDP-N-acetylglucosamine O-acyltransferase